MEQLKRKIIGYSKPSIIIHWLIAILILCTYLFIENRGIFPKGSEERDFMKLMHFNLGLTIFFLVWIRILFRLIFKSAKASSEISKYHNFFAKCIQFLLYGLMVFLPLAGWSMLNAYGADVSVWGISLPTLISPDESTAGLIKEWHERVALFGYWLIGLHTAGALFNHYVLKNNILKRMWFSK